jgi:dTDP-4-amino-4,6-dideoxygalactose transaminase
MRAQNILVRRYFHPLISEFPMYRGLPSANPGNLPVAHAAARRVLCLPIHPDLASAEVDRVCDLIVAQLRMHAA